MHPPPTPEERFTWFILCLVLAVIVVGGAVVATFATELIDFFGKARE